VEVKAPDHRFWHIAGRMMTGAYALSTGAAQEAASPVLQSLPAKVQKEIEDVRTYCRKHLVNANESQTRVFSGDEGLEVFTVSGVQAVMIDERELCDGCFKGANCSNRGSYDVTIYLRSGKAWRKALSTEATGSVFLSTDRVKDPAAFKALVLNVFGGNKDCPTRDIPLGRVGKERLFLPAWKQSCAAVVKWNGTKFTYKPL